MIERDLPGPGKLSPGELQADKLCCVYLAENEADIRSHANGWRLPGQPNLAHEDDDRPDQGPIDAEVS